VSANSFDAVFAAEAIQPVSVPSYRQSVYQAVRAAILAGRLAPGQPLVEEQLAASLKVSRTPVREALAILEHEGFIGPRGNRGLYVCNLTRAEFVDMFVANEAVEPYLMRRAALLATEEHLLAVEETIERAHHCMQKKDMAGFLRASRDFHHTVGIASGNVSLTNFVVNNEERTDMYLLHSGKIIDVAKMEASQQEHEAIFTALVRRDPEAAQRLTIYHAQSLRERFSELFQRQENEVESEASSPGTERGA